MKKQGERRELRGEPRHLDSLRGFLLSLCGAFLLSGCLTYDEHVVKAQTDIAQGRYGDALEWSQDLQDSTFSKQLGKLETGRIMMLSGDFHGSSTNFSPLIESMIEDSDSGPIIKMGSVGGEVLAGTITDDRTRPYSVPGFQLIQAMDFEAFNQLFLGQLDNAVVQLRRAASLQDYLAEQDGKAPDANVSDADTAAVGVVNSNATFTAMNSVLPEVRHSYENPLSWYLFGLMLEKKQGDLSNAAIAYRRAHELSPANPLLSRDYLRLAQRVDPSRYQFETTQGRMNPVGIPRGDTEIVLVLEEGFAPLRYSEKIVIPTVGWTMVSALFPLYLDPAYVPAQIEASCGGQALAFAVPTLSVQAQAYRELREEMPGIIARNVTRAATRIGAQVAAHQAKNDWVDAGVFIFNAVSAVINQADTRSWYTLPRIVQVARFNFEPGSRHLVLRNRLTGASIEIPLCLAKGETRLLWLADSGGSLVGVEAPTQPGAKPANMFRAQSIMTPQYTVHPTQY
jgi:hypothetical protein